MQTNLSIVQSQINFKAQVAKGFIRNTNNFFKYYDRENKKLLTQFDKKVEAFKDYGYDDYFIKYVKKDFNGERKHILIAVKSGMADNEGVVLTSKDKFRKAVEKFTHINKYEFTKKMQEKINSRFPNRIIVE